MKTNMNILKLLAGGIAMLCFSILARAQVQERPHVAGYAYGASVSESPEAIAVLTQ